MIQFKEIKPAIEPKYTPFRYFIFSRENKLIGVASDRENRCNNVVTISEANVKELKPDALFSFRVKKMTTNTRYFIEKTNEIIFLNLYHDHNN